MFRDFEVILVDDVSTDDSYELCKDFSMKDLRVRVIHQENQGTAAARNKGMDLVQGKYIYFADPDDHFQNNLLEDNYLLAEKYKANIVIFNFSVKCRSGKLINSSRLRRRFYKSRSDFRQSFPKIYLNGLINPVWNKLYLKSSIKRIKFEDRKITEDAMFNIEYCQSLSRVYCNPKIYYYYTYNQINSAMNKDRFDSVKYSIEVNKSLSRMINEDWHKKDNIYFHEFIKKVYLGTAISALREGEKVKNKHRRALIDEMIINNLGQYLGFSLNNSLKENYYVLILRLRHVPFILKIDSLIYYILKGRKNK